MNFHENGGIFQYDFMLCTVADPDLDLFDWIQIQRSGTSGARGIIRCLLIPLLTHVNFRCTVPLRALYLFSAMAYGSYVAIGILVLRAILLLLTFIAIYGAAKGRDIYKTYTQDAYETYNLQ
jgi:hypothetical protein